MPRFKYIVLLGIAAMLVIGCGGSSKGRRSAAVPAEGTGPAGQLPGDKVPPEECIEKATQHELTYLENILPVVNKYCIGCHYPSAAAGGWTLDRYAVLNPDQLGPVEAWKKILTSVESGKMPPNKPISPEDLATLKKWVGLGSPKQNTTECEEPSRDLAPSLLSCDSKLAVETKPRVWRLTHSQWGNTTRAILGADHSEELNFASDPALYGFDNFSEALRITILQTNRYREATQRLANQILDTPRISALRDIYSPGWGPDANGDRDRFIKNFGFHLYRRPIDFYWTADKNLPKQMDLLRNIHTEGRKSGIGYKLLIEAMLQSPIFLFRSEIGKGGSLNQFGVAEVLSFTIWDEGPDLILLNLASESKLSGAVLKEQISRLLASPKAERLFVRFFGSLLSIKNVKNVSKSEALFPSFNDEVADLMYREFLSMVQHVVTKKDSSLPALFSGLPSFSDSNLASFHSVASNSSSLIETDIRKRGSVLTSLAFLTANAGAEDNNPFLRGKVIREKLLCMPLSSPPANVPPLDATPNTGFKTRKERFAAHSSSASCVGCHKMIDDLGFSLDSFDAIGRWQAEAGGLPVDTKGKFTAFFDGTSNFADAAEMSKNLGNSAHLSQCISIQLFRFIRGREDSKSDGCQISKAHGDFSNDGTNLKSLVRSILTNDAFYKIAE